MRIVHVVTAPEFVHYVLRYDLRHMRDRTEATVVCADGAVLDLVRAEGFRVVPMRIHRKISPLADALAILNLWWFLRRERCDLLHSYVPKGGLVGQIAAWLARVPRRVHSCRGLLYLPTMVWWRRWLFRCTDWLTNRLADRTIYISRTDLEHSVQSRLCSRRTARYVGSGIDLSWFDPSQVSTSARAAVRARLNIPAEAVVVLTVGRFVADKGYWELADAVRRLRRDDPRLHFLWVAPTLAGEDGVLPDTLLDSPELGGAVHRVGEQRDIRPFYKAADFLAHPSYREGVPRVVMEAAAMGIPIVASDIPGCREVVTDGVSGWLVPPGDARALARALREAVDAPAEARRRAVEARRVATMHLDVTRVGERIWQVYQELV